MKKLQILSLVLAATCVNAIFCMESEGQQGATSTFIPPTNTAKFGDPKNDSLSSKREPTPEAILRRKMLQAIRDAANNQA